MPSAPSRPAALGVLALSGATSAEGGDTTEEHWAPRWPPGRGRRLLIVSDTLAGGHGASVVKQAAWFRDAGWDVRVAAPAGEAHALEEPGHAPIPMPPTVRSVTGMVAAIRTVRALRRTWAPDVVHAVGARSFAVTRASGRGAPYVTVHFMTTVPSDPPGFRHIRRLGLRLIPRLSAVAFSGRPDSPGRWQFVPHASDRLTELDRLPFPEEGPLKVLWVGRMSEPKTPGMFVDAVALAAQRCDIVGVMVGDGPLLSEVRQRVAEIGAPVEVLGHVPDPLHLLPAAWAAAMFSVDEALNMTVQDAMWAGRAAVCTPLAGMSWLVGDTGLFASDAHEAADAFVTLSDHGEAHRRGDAAATRIRHRLTPDDPWPMVADAYG
jgi:glycosyltransferase involved in cell wall biosynthesis